VTPSRKKGEERDLERELRGCPQRRSVIQQSKNRGEGRNASFLERVIRSRDQSRADFTREAYERGAEKDAPPLRHLRTDAESVLAITSERGRQNTSVRIARAGKDRGKEN